MVKAIRSFAMQAGILKNISAFANLKLIKVIYPSQCFTCFCFIVAFLLLLVFFFFVVFLVGKTMSLTLCLQEDLRADMQESGVLLHDVTRKANSSDLAILVEILKLVIDNKPPHCIVLISGDRDFANVLSTLIFRKYQVYLVHSPQVKYHTTTFTMFLVITTPP